MHCAEEGQLDCKICKLVLNTRVSRVQRHNAMFLVNPVEHFLLYELMLIQNYWQDELINHLKIHAGSRTVKGSVDKKFSCNQCDKKFFTRKDLKRHRYIIMLFIMSMISKISTISTAWCTRVTASSAALTAPSGSGGRIT